MGGRGRHHSLGGGSVSRCYIAPHWEGVDLADAGRGSSIAHNLYYTAGFVFLLSSNSFCTCCVSLNLVDIVFVFRLSGNIFCTCCVSLYMYMIVVHDIRLCVHTVLSHIANDFAHAVCSI